MLQNNAKCKFLKLCDKICGYDINPNFRVTKKKSCDSFVERLVPERSAGELAEPDVLREHLRRAPTLPGPCNNCWKENCDFQDQKNEGKRGFSERTFRFASMVLSEV